MPPLAERLEDLPLLAHFFAEKAAREGGRPAPRISADVFDILSRYAFPGNVRELRNIIERAVVFCSGDEIGPSHLAPELLDAPFHMVRAGERQPMTLEECEVDQIRWTLEHVGGNRTMAAKMLGIDRASLWRKMKRYGLQEDL
jgi:DNA-binding NtrC family response regulator